jgi:hypothetical protein
MGSSVARLSIRKRVVIGVALGVATATLLIQSATAPALATTGAGQSDPAWDFGRGGIADNGIACYMPAPDQTRKKMYNLYRPACFGVGHLQ